MRITCHVCRVELKRRQEKFDVIIADFVDLIEGPSRQLYSKVFYEDAVKPNLSDGGIFLTQVSVQSSIRQLTIIALIIVVKD